MQKGNQKGFLRNGLEFNKPHVHLLLLLLLSYRHLLFKSITIQIQ
jgi:hypothetical protein